jgi:hypothetical protein
LQHRTTRSGTRSAMVNQPLEKPLENWERLVAIIFVPLVAGFYILGGGSFLMWLGASEKASNNIVLALCLLSVIAFIVIAHGETHGMSSIRSGKTVLATVTLAIGLDRDVHWRALHERALRVPRLPRQAVRRRSLDGKPAVLRRRQRMQYAAPGRGAQSQIFRTACQRRRRACSMISYRRRRRPGRRANAVA